MGCLDQIFDSIPFSNKIGRAMDFRSLAIVSASLSFLLKAFYLFLTLIWTFNIVSHKWYMNTFDWFFVNVEKPSNNCKSIRNIYQSLVQNFWIYVTYSTTIFWLQCCYRLHQLYFRCNTWHFMYIWSCFRKHLIILV